MSTTRRRVTATVAAAGLVGAAVGIGGASLALWRDSVEVGGAVSTGYQSFAVGSPGATVVAPSGTADFTVGSEAAAALVRDGEVAVPVQVDSVSQGNKGLHYTVTPPASWGEGVLGASAVHVFRVDSPAACTTEALSPDTVPAPGPLSSTPVPATYTTGTEPVSEYWCVYASYDGPPALGEYANTATVTAVAPGSEQVSDEDGWNATVVADLDPADEPDHVLSFTSTTFRPGQEP